MRMFIYTIYDSASAAYMRPFFMQSDGQAVRAFTDISTDADHDIGKHPEDYSLYLVGEFNDNNAEIKKIDKTCLVTAQEVVAKSRNIPTQQPVEVK